MDFNQVKFFLTLADTLNFTRAAEQCHVSQPALTQAIKRLEEELGGKLIERNGSSNELSELGRSLRVYFEQIDRTKHLVHSTAKAITSGEVAELNLGLMCTVGPQLLARMLDKFQTRHPMVSFVFHDVTPESIDHLLLSGVLDGVICAQPQEKSEQFEYLSLYKEELVVIFKEGHIFDAMESVPLSAIAEQNYIDRLHCEFRPQFLAYCQDQDIEPNIAFRSQREDWIQSLILNGVGVCMLPKYSLLSTQLHYRPIDEPGMFREIELVWVKDMKKSPALNKMIDLVSDYSW